jgi:parallel beta-helix repeat protein
MVKKFCLSRAAGRLIVVFGLVAGGMAALTPLAQAAAGGTLYVNGTTGNDTGTCRLPAHPCATISYALTQSATDATSTIKVTAGFYPEPLAITHSVTIAGAGDTGSGTVIDPSTLISDTDTDSSTPQEAIVDVTDTTGVTLKGLDISGGNAGNNFAWPGCGDDFVGVYYHDSSGTMTKVQVTGVELPADLFGCQDGLAVYVASDAGDTSSVTMSALKVNNFDKNGVTCDDEGTTCTLGHSNITGIGATGLIAANGFQGVDTASVTLNHDTIKDNSYTGGGFDNEATGILIFDVGTVSATDNTLSANDVNGYFGSDGGGPGGSTWTISGNTVNNATDNVPGGYAGYGYGIQLDSTGNPVSITGNTVSHSAAYGIALTGANNATVSGNTVTDSGSDGIYVGGPGTSAGATLSTADVIEDNTANANQGDGIHADTDAAFDTFSGNTANRNLIYDLQDAGTGNVWSGNTCMPTHDSSPSYLCA